ncbi:uncharacterized protein LOC106714606 [Papilio machaon]|uniref:uncharacterized protein LOC106714606 n=1 Tax=Papilio machaon TaxID=76193 RepID=UPI001E66347C|nr:uncharacterized protein LOC106714606 [Papilio machaon]
MYLVFAVLSLIYIAGASRAPCVELNDGNLMPIVALGTGRGTAKENESVDEVRKSVFWALEAGYRHIDTAAVYDDEEQVGQGIAEAIQKNIVTREDIFVTTKLWNDKHRREQVVPALQESLRRLGLDYVDLYLIHFPVSTKEDGSADSVDYLETWKGMEDAKQLGLVKSIGVSNFNIEQLQRLMANSYTRPVVNEVEVSPTFTQESMVAFCRQNGIVVMGYSPFGFFVGRDSTTQIDKSALLQIADKYGKSFGQVILRYLIERGVVPIPKSTNQKRIVQNIDLFDFSLTEQEVALISGYNTNKKTLTWALQAPVTLLNDGNKMPILALGTAGSKDDISRMRQAVYWAIEAGYRHIDTAEFYRDEVEVGLGIADAIKKGLVTREDLFITTKLWNNHHARSAVIPALQESLKRLGLNYVDLYLVHSPIAIKDDGTAEDIDYLETWHGMEDAKKRGLAKSIGVSNFNSEQISRIIKECEVKPAVNQIEVNPTLSQEPLIAYCRSVDVAVMSYSPFGFMVSRRKQDTPPPRFDDPELIKIAQKYGKSTSQIILRYLIDRGTTPIPKSTSKDRIIQNIDIFDFSLTDEEIDSIKKFNKNIRVYDFIEWKDHPYYAFNKP